MKDNEITWRYFREGKNEDVLASGSSVEDPAAREILRQNYFIEAQMRGDDDKSIGGLNINTSGRQNLSSVAEEKRKRSTDDAVFYALLDDMRQRLDELEARMAKQYKTLQQKYGDNVIDGMVNTYLTDEEKAGLQTEKDKMNALAKKFLNPDGTIKEKYKDLDEAKYVRDWYEAETLRPIVAKYEGRNDLSADEKREVYDAAQNTSLSDNKNMMAQSGNAEFRETIDQKLDQDCEGMANSVGSNDFKWS